MLAMNPFGPVSFTSGAERRVVPSTSGSWFKWPSALPKPVRSLIGACADLGHYIRSAEDPVRAINLFEGRLYGIHLKDFAEQKSRTKGVILGKGHLDVVGVFKALRKVNFPADGCLSLEYEESPKDPVAEIRECLAVASEAAKQSAG